MSKDNKKLETDLFKSRDEQNSVERVVNNFLKLLKYDYLVLSTFYFAKAKYPSSTNIHAANNYFLFYDYVGQIFKNAAKEVDTTFSFSSSSNNYSILTLRQVYRDIVSGSTSFTVELFTAELNDYLNRLSGVIAKSNVIFKNWSQLSIGLDTASINKKIKERENILNIANKKFSEDLSFVTEQSYLDDLDLVFSKFVNGGRIGVYVKSDNVLEVTENLKLTNNMISVLKAFFLFKSNAVEKINSSYTSQSSTTTFRIDVLPTLSVFPVSETARRFMSYRVTNIQYELLPRFNISSTPGTLPTLYRVPVQSQMLPGPTVAAFTNFANVNVSTLKGSYRGSFKPLMYVDASNSS